MPERAVMSATWFFDDAGGCGAGDPEQQKEGNEVAHQRFLSMFGACAGDR
jgi:hypothetical protein